MPMDHETFEKVRSWYPIEPDIYLSSLFSARWSDYHLLRHPVRRPGLPDLLEFLRETDDIEAILFSAPNIGYGLGADLRDLLLVFSDRSIAFVGSDFRDLVGHEFSIHPGQFPWPLHWRQDHAGLQVRQTSSALKNIPQAHENAKFSGSQLIEAAQIAWVHKDRARYFHGRSSRNWSDDDVEEIGHLLGLFAATLFPGRGGTFLLYAPFRSIVGDDPLSLGIGLRQDGGFRQDHDVSRAILGSLNQIKPIAHYEGFEWDYRDGPPERQSSYEKMRALIARQTFEAQSAHARLAAHAELQERGLGEAEIARLQDLVHTHLPG